MDDPNAPVDQAADKPAAQDLEEAKADRDKFKDLAYRAAAELENYKRRAARDREDTAAAQKERVVARMIPILDAFDIAVEHVDSGVPDDVRKKYLDGVLAIGRQMTAALESMGLQVIDIPANAEFHPGEQEAVLTEEVAALSAPMVLQVLQKGYRLDGRLIRPVRVKVGIPAEGAGPSDENKRGDES